MLDVIIWVVFIVLGVTFRYCCPCMCRGMKSKCGKQKGDTGQTGATAAGIEMGDMGTGEADPMVLKMEEAAEQRRAAEGPWYKSKKFWINFAFTFVVVAVVSYILLCVILAIYIAAYENDLTFEPVAAADCRGGSGFYDCDYTVPNPTYPSVVPESVTFASTDGTELNGWYMANTTMPAGGGPVPPLNILYSHGSGRNIAVNYRMARYEYLLSLGNVRLFVYDYAGYGASGGSPDFTSLKASANGARKYFTERLGVTSDDVVYLGRSLGGGVAAYLARGNKPRGMVMQSTFANLKETAANGFPIAGWVISLVYSIDLDSESNLEDYDNCYFQSHSVDDEVVEYDDGRSLYDHIKSHLPAGCSEFLRVSGLEHDDPMGAEERMQLRPFLNGLRAP